MAQAAHIESLVGTIPCDGLSGDRYTNEMPLVSKAGVQAAFGGSLLGQSVTAAAATVPVGFYLYSMQCGFLRPADGKENVTYDVERIADGRTYATRIVRATQSNSNASIFVATLSFQKHSRPANNVLRYGIPMPDVGGVRPEHIPREKIHQLIAAGMGKDVPIIRLGASEEPFDWRPLDPQIADNPTQYRNRSFVRSAAISLDSNVSVHHAALAYLSDTHLLGTAWAASPALLGPRIENLAMSVSLNHNVSLHDPTARVDEWMFGERETSWGADGRALIHQRFWSVETGRLVMSGTQEALVRLKDSRL